MAEMNYGTKRHGDVGEVYYKLIKSYRNDLITIACIQWFDEYDYDQSRFVRNSDNEIHVFESEELAQEKLNKWFKPEEIDPEYRTNKNPDLVRD